VPRPENSRTPADLDLPYETVRIPVADGGEIEAWHVLSEKPGLLAILLHGYAAEKSALLTEARLLHGLGHAVLLVDFRGSGESTGSVTTSGVREAEDVAAVFAYARRRWPARRILLLGQSMGAAAVLRAAAVHGVRPDYIVAEAVFDTMLNTVRNRFATMGVPSFPSAQLLVFWGGRQVGFDGFAHNPVDYAASVACPVLFLHGEEDPRATPAQARRVYDRISGTKRLVTFPGVGHRSYAAARPREWLDAVEDFVREGQE
jgi:dipeptidyl aminopeptidase/acylaminoacyl peptidase